MQLRLASFAVISSREDFHPQECAHAGRTNKNPSQLLLTGISTFWWVGRDSNPGLTDYEFGGDSLLAQFAIIN